MTSLLQDALEIYAALKALPGILEKRALRIVITITITASLAGAAFVVVGVRTNAPGARDVAGANTVNIVPASGAQGYPIEAFACDPATTVKLSLPQPDSLFVATYDLDRRLNGIHETAQVSLYASGAGVATHYDSANIPSDGVVTEKAIKCVKEKAE